MDQLKSLLLVTWLAVESIPTAKAQTFESVVTLPNIALGAGLTRPVAGPEGKLYATATLGGANENGTLLAFTTNGTITKIADFNEATGARPGSVTVGADQKFYMVTAFGRKLTSVTTAGELTPVVTFNDFGINSSTGVTRASDDALYGTALKLTTGSVIFRYTPEDGFETLFNFNETTGDSPVGSLVEGTDGALYGLTRKGPPPERPTAGGPVEPGTAFRMTKDGSFKTLATFSGPSGDPAGSLVQANDGNFYGAANSRNPNGQDVIFRMSPAGKLETIAIMATPNVDLAGSLIVGPGGDLFGLAYFSEGESLHSIFKVSLKGVVTVVKRFDAGTTSPASGLSLGPDGNLYGTMGSTLFRLATSNQSPTANNDIFELPVIHANVIANDSDPNNDPVQVISVTDGFHGTVTFTPDGTVTYSPGPDFDGDEVQSDTFAYTISDPLGGTTTATVTVNMPDKIFRAGAGVYNGVLTLGGAPKGSFNLTLTKNGSFTATLIVDGIRTPVTGSFEADGTFSAAIPRKEPLPPLTLTLQLEAISNVVTGTISDGMNSYSANLSRNLKLFSPTRPNPHQGKYTALIANNQTGPSLPGGTGFARMTVGATGAVVITGKLGDGTPFSAGSSLNSDDAFPLYVKAYSRNEGYVAGQIAFRTGETSQADGLLTWRKPARENDVRYPDGFTTAPTFLASRYFKPPTFDFLGLGEDATLTVGDKPAKQLEHNEPLSFTMRVLPITDGTKVKFDPLTGLFRGAYFDGDVRFPLEGVIYQHDNPSRAEGLSIDQNETIKVSITSLIAP
jgi:hypothetical protein